MFLYPAACEPIAYTAYICFCDSECNWMDEFRVACVAIRLVGLGHTSFCGQWEDWKYIHCIWPSSEVTSFCLQSHWLEGTLWTWPEQGPSSAPEWWRRAQQGSCASQLESNTASKPSVGRDFIFSEAHTLSRMCPETKQQLQTSIFLSLFPILAHPQAEQ